MTLKMRIKVTPRSGRYYAEIWDGKILLDKVHPSNNILSAKQSGAARLAQFKKEREKKPPVHYRGTYQRPLDYDNKCYRIDPITGERTPL